VIRSIYRQVLAWLRQQAEQVSETPARRAYRARITLHRNPSELGPDITADVQFGHIDLQDEVVLAEGMTANRYPAGIPVTTSQYSDSAMVGRVLNWSRAGKIISFAIRFGRSGIPLGYLEDVKQTLKEGVSMRLEFGFIAVSSGPATRAERKELKLSWLSPSPIIHRQWELLCVSLHPEPHDERCRCGTLKLSSIAIKPVTLA